MGILRKFTALFLFSVQQRTLLNIKLHNLSFLRNFEFQKSVQYFLLKLHACVRVREGIYLRGQLEFREHQRPAGGHLRACC